MSTLHHTLRQKRILFLVNSLGGGGAEHVFVKQLNALHTQGYDVSLATLYPSPEGRSIESLLTIPKDKRLFLGFRSLFDVRALWRFLRLMRGTHFDLVYSTLHEANAVARFLALARSSRTAFVVREASTAEKKPSHLKRWDRWTMSRVRRVIAVSEEVETSLLAYMPHAKEKIVILHNGVDVAPPHLPADTAVRSLLTVGRCTEAKNQGAILQALYLLQGQADLPPHVFHLAGDGALKTSLEAQTQALGLSRCVRFYGHLAPKQVSELYQAADIFLLSSLWEGSPNVLLEAMAHGVACVATRVGGVPFILRHEETGLLVPPGDVQTLANAIRRLLVDSDLRQRLGQAARAHIEANFSFSKHLEHLLDVFQTTTQSL